MPHGRASGASGRRLLCEDKRVCVTEGRRLCVKAEWSGVDELGTGGVHLVRIEEVLNSIHHVLHEDVAGLHHRRSKWAGEHFKAQPTFELQHVACEDGGHEQPNPLCAPTHNSVLTMVSGSDRARCAAWRVTHPHTPLPLDLRSSRCHHVEPCDVAASLSKTRRCRAHD